MAQCQLHGQIVRTNSTVRWVDGLRLRARPSLERERLLRDIIPEQPCVVLYASNILHASHIHCASHILYASRILYVSHILYASHIERDGVEFFRLTCDQDLERIVAKLKNGRYWEG
jgi:ATP-dependent DNA ligase